MENKRVVVSEYGGLDVLDVIQEPLRSLLSEEIRIKVETAGVASADIMKRKGIYPSSPTPPFTPGYDAIGYIDVLGDGIQQFSIGNRVAVLFDGSGGYSSYIYARMEDLVSVPRQVDGTLAVAVILNYVTAYQMLHRIAKVQKGDHILIHGASGGVGTALLELGRIAGLNMFGTASTSKHSIVKKYGAFPIDYRTEDFVDVLHRKVPQGVDAVFDPIGGSNWDRSLEALNKNGRFIGYGYSSVFSGNDTNDWTRDWSKFAVKKVSEKGNPIHLYSLTTLKGQRSDWFQEDLTYLFTLLEKGDIHPVVSHRIPLEQIKQAHELLENSQVIGKVVLTI